MKQLIAKLQPLQTKAEEFCNQFAQAISFDDASDVQLNNDFLCFTVNWHGPQAENHEDFVIPVQLLLMEPKEVAVIKGK